MAILSNQLEDYDARALSKRTMNRIFGGEQVTCPVGHYIRANP